METLKETEKGQLRGGFSKVFLLCQHLVVLLVIIVFVLTQGS